MHVCISVFKCLNYLVPKNINELFIQNHNNHIVTMEGEKRPHFPKIKCELGKRSFSFNEPIKLTNCLLKSFTSHLRFRLLAFIILKFVLYVCI